MRQAIIAVLFSLVCSLASATELVRSRPLLEYADILLAQELDTVVNTLNDRMSQCVNSGAGNYSECYCRNSAEVGTAKSSYEKVLEARPKWKGKALFWKDPKDLASHNLVMPAIESLIQSPSQGCDPKH